MQSNKGYSESRESYNSEKKIAKTKISGKQLQRKFAKMLLKNNTRDLELILYF